MKKYCPLFVLFFCSAVSHASEDCVSELSSSSNYSDLNAILSCFNGKIRTLEIELKDLEGQEGKGKKNVTDTPSVEKTKTPAKPVAIQTVEKKGLIFSLLQCGRKEKKNIVCEFSVVSNKDTRLTVYAGYATDSTIAIATSGIQYTASSASLGDSGQQDQYASYRMVSGLPLTLLIGFSSIPNTEEGFALLEVDGGTRFTALFRDVYFTGQ